MKAEIKEITFNVEDDEELARAFNIEPTAGLSWVYLAYIAETEENHILITIANDFQPMPAISLREYLAGKEINSLFQVAAALDIYFNEVFHGLDEPHYTIDGNKCSSLIANAILKDSGGRLIWHHQLEMILACAGIQSYPDCVQLRKDLNAKKIGAWERIKNLFLPDGYSVAQIMENRCLSYQCTSPGNWRGAALLCKIISGNAP